MKFESQYQEHFHGEFNPASSLSGHPIKSIINGMLKNATHSLIPAVNSIPKEKVVYLSLDDRLYDLRKTKFDLTQVLHIVCQSYFSHSPNILSDLYFIYNALPNQGSLIIQEVNFSEVNSFPFNFALGRFKNLYKEIGRISNYDYKVGRTISTKLIEAGFIDIERSYLPPIFLNQKQRDLLNYLFDFISNVALAHNFIVEEEKIALAAEISSYLKDDKHMVSLPGVYQVKAIK